MVAKTVEITNKLGLHARPASHLVKISAKYQCKVYLNKEGFEINAKSIMGVMMLAAERGAQLEIKCEGPDEQECLDALVKLVEDKFYEE